MANPDVRRPPPNSTRLGVLICLGGLALQGAGCAALPVATVGTLLGVTASAVSTGTEIYQLGKLDTAELAPLDDATRAARAAADDLCLRPRGKHRRKGRVVRLAFADDKGAPVKVRLERRTAMLVRVRVDVGLLGSEATARLFLSRLRARLPAPALTSSPWRNSRGPMRRGFGPGPRRRDKAVLIEIRASLDNDGPGPKTQAAAARVPPRAASPQPSSAKCVRGSRAGSAAGRSESAAPARNRDSGYRNRQLPTITPGCRST